MKKPIVSRPMSADEAAYFAAKMGRPVSTGRDVNSAQVVVRLNDDEARKLDALRGSLTRAAYLRQLLAAKRERGPSSSPRRRRVGVSSR